MLKRGFSTHYLKLYTFRRRYNMDASVSQGAPVVGCSRLWYSSLSRSASFVVTKIGADPFVHEVSRRPRHVRVKDMRRRCKVISAAKGFLFRE